MNKKYRFIKTNIEYLRQKSEPVSPAEAVGIASRLKGYLVMCGDKGSGLSAIQIGVPKRVCVVKLSEGTKTLINPEVTYRGDEVETKREGCLSFSGRRFLVERPLDIKIKYLNESGDTVEISLMEQDARIVLHEIDHMDGIVIPDIGKEVT